MTNAPRTATSPAHRDVPIRGRDQRLYDLRMAISEVSPREAYALQERGAELVDVREPEETAFGSPAGAHRIVRGFLELQAEQELTDKSRTVLVVCGHGIRSLFAAEDLLQLGYEDVRSVAGGYQRWRMDGLPVEVPEEAIDDPPVLPTMGEEEHRRLREARVLVVGAGGVGTSAALALAGAGVGTLGLVDDGGAERPDPRRAMLAAVHPALEVAEYPDRLTSEDVEEILRGYDVVLDGSEDLATRYLVHDACVKLGLPCVHGSVRGSEGLVSTFWPAHREEGGPCYRCLQPTPPAPPRATADEGIGGVVPGVLGTLCAAEAVKLLLGLGEPLVGRLLHVDALSMRVGQTKVTADPDCTHCREPGSFPGYVDYQASCAARRPEDPGERA